MKLTVVEGSVGSGVPSLPHSPSSFLLLPFSLIPTGRTHTGGVHGVGSGTGEEQPTAQIF